LAAPPEAAATGAASLSAAQFCTPARFGAAASLPLRWRQGGLMRRLAERGTVKELQAICGHATLGEVERYTKAADQRVLSEAAIAKLSRD
jgi:predicted PhzF superfamily epimerase YddE/YHI9